MSTDQNSLNIQAVELSSLLRQLESTELGNANAAVKINCVLGAGKLYVETDPQALRQVLACLLDNAVKYTERGSITFGYDVNDDEIYFYVKDTGVGVPRPMQDEIFDEGQNLGLARETVEALGGDIGVDSRGTGKGSTFWFTIPNKEAEGYDNDANGVVEVVVTPAVADDEPLPQSPVMAHDTTILIAEDNESNYLLFRSILESQYNLIHAYNGQEAIDMYQKHHPDLILMDINMPVIDGYEATAEIRKLSATVPIVAVTAYAFTTDKQRIFQNGFNGYVSKPISINRLQRVINELLAAR